MPLDEKEVALVRNAIAWTFYGTEGEEQVSVTDEQRDICDKAARRALVGLKSYRAQLSHAPTNLISHATDEMIKAGVDPKEAEGLLKVIEAMSTAGRSVDRTGDLLDILTRLMNFRNLTPLTDDPAEWIHVGPASWYNIRNREAFSDDGGKTYYLMSELEESDEVMPVRRISEPHRPRDILSDRFTRRSHD